MEVFDQGKDVKGKSEAEEADLNKVAKQAMEAHRKLIHEVVKYCSIE